MEGATSAAGPHPRAGGRTSARHGNVTSSSASPPAFSGPVRRWEKKWVHVSSNPPPLGRHLRSSSRNKTKTSKPSRAGAGEGAAGPGILLCKWTPLPHPTASDVDGVGTVLLAPPRRRFRYTPTVVYEEQQKKASKNMGYEATPGGAIQKPVLDDNDFFEMLNVNQNLMGGPQAPEIVHSLLFGNGSF